MESVQSLVDQINHVLWGVPLIVLLLGTGIYLTLGLALMPIRKLGYGFRMLWQGRASKEEGQISPFNALMTALSSTIGTGNIAGVATAIAIGGPGALFWMWCTALVGMSTKFAEAVLAVKFREVDEKGQYVGGPMYYIKNGLSPKWKWLGTAFALFGALAGFGLANTVQSNSVANVLESTFDIPIELTAVVITILVASVILGGIERIAQVAGKLVPFMAISYIVA
ncbi:MAG: alanine:cation symporter family protein, partial [Pseudomonadales bacterium]|nr:alanine:cation symporter family protein [Pseudomonadales bacterium]